MDRVFLDANVLFSAAYRVHSGLLRSWKLAGVELLTSSYALEEARRNLVDDAQRERLTTLLTEVRVVEEALPSETAMDVELPEKDWPILAAAIRSRATHLLTGDKTHFGKYFGRRLKGILVLTPGEYLRLRS